MNKRPIHLDLTTLKFPVTAIVSILHRISGVVLFFLMPFWLYALKLSLESPESFEAVRQLLKTPFWKLAAFAYSTALIYHLFAGLRHIMMDIGWGESLCAARQSSGVVVLLSVVGAILLGVWLW